MLHCVERDLVVSRRLRRALPAVWIAAALLPPVSLRADLASYVAAPDPSFSWKVENTLDVPGGGSVVLVRLVSQTWRGIPWEHWLGVIRPEKVLRPESALLVVAGGSVRKEAPRRLPGEVTALAPVARKTGTIIAVLSQVPNQPLFENLKEDALISYTFQKFLETGDETWPCLLPMAKSAVKAMDAVQALSKEKFSQEVKRFVVTGASKRGWTTWLTAAVDPRVAAIAPMVIDTLNFPEQMKLQVKSFGTYSEEIGDYTEKGLPDRLQDPSAKKLLDLVDPYRHLRKFTMPKLVVLGTNDRYWPVDAVKLYYPDLPGEKYIHYVPNAGHGLGPGAVEAISAFYQTVIAGEPMPRFSWSFKASGREAVLSIEAKDAPVKAELWKAAAKTRDFRDSTWSAAPLTAAGEGRWEGKLPVPDSGFAALFGRLTYKSSLGHEYTLSTNVEVLGDKSPAGSTPASSP